MKRITYTLFLFAFTTSLFYSCNSSKSFHQKHFQKRQYIGMGQKESADIIDQRLMDDDSEDKTQANYTTNNSLRTNAGGNELKQIDVVRTSNSNFESEVMAATNDNRIKQSVEQTKDTKSIKIVPSSISKKINATHKKMASSRSGDALSFLWIVIVILLILWLIGWLAGGLGLGGFIHVLALIALILLILWLLRII